MSKYNDLVRRFENTLETVPAVKDLVTVEATKLGRVPSIEKQIVSGKKFSSSNFNFVVDTLKGDVSDNKIANVIAMMDSSGTGAKRGKDFEKKALAFCLGLSEEMDEILEVKVESTVEWHTDFVDIELVLSSGSSLYLSLTTDVWTGTAQSNRLASHVALAEKTGKDYFELIVGKPPKFSSRSKSHKLIDKHADRVLFLGDLKSKIKEIVLV